MEYEKTCSSASEQWFKFFEFQAKEWNEDEIFKPEDWGWRVKAKHLKMKNEGETFKNEECVSFKATFEYK